MAIGIHDQIVIKPFFVGSLVPLITDINVFGIVGIPSCTAGIVMRLLVSGIDIARSRVETIGTRVNPMSTRSRDTGKDLDNRARPIIARISDIEGGVDSIIVEESHFPRSGGVENADNFIKIVGYIFDPDSFLIGKRKIVSIGNLVSVLVILDFRKIVSFRGTAGENHNRSIREFSCLLHSFFCIEACIRFIKTVIG